MEDALVLRFDEELAALEPDGVRRARAAARSAPRSSRPATASGSVTGERATSSCSSGSASTCAASRSSTTSRRATCGRFSRRATSAQAATLLGRPAEVEGTVVHGDHRGADARLPDREPRGAAGPARAGARDLRRRRARPPRLRSRSAPIRTTAAPSGGSRRTCSTSRATSTGSGSWSSSGSASATRRHSSPRPSSSRRSSGTWSGPAPPSGPSESRIDRKFVPPRASLLCYGGNRRELGVLTLSRERPLPRVRRGLREARRGGTVRRTRAARSASTWAGSRSGCPGSRDCRTAPPRVCRGPSSSRQR